MTTLSPSTHRAQLRTLRDLSARERYTFCVLARLRMERVVESEDWQGSSHRGVIYGALPVLAEEWNPMLAQSVVWSAAELALDVDSLAAEAQAVWAGQPVTEDSL
jgi:hypothetical protein